MDKKHLGYVYLALCILFWASIPVASKKILTELNNIQMLFYSTLFSLLILGILLIKQDKVRLLLKTPRKDMINLIMLGFLGTYLYYVLLYGAFALTTAQEGFILAYTWPILVLLLAIVILKEKITLKKIAAILISFFGIIVIITQGNLSSLALTNVSGNTLAIGAAFVFALFSVLGKKHKSDKTLAAFIYFTSAFFFITFTVLIVSPPSIPSGKVWLWLLYNGVLVNGITYVWWFESLSRVETHVVSTLLYLTPFVSLVYIWFFLGERILLSSVAGLVIIIVGILLQSYNKKSEA